jgi:hypothetical protein
VIALPLLRCGEVIARSIVARSLFSVVSFDQFDRMQRQSKGAMVGVTSP